MTTPVNPIDLVELRIERRRVQLRRDWEEARAYVAQKNRWTPLVAVAGIAALGFGLSRDGTRSTPPPHAGAMRGGALAAVAAMLGGGLRFALSPTGRALWASLNRARSGR